MSVAVLVRQGGASGERRDLGWGEGERERLAALPRLVEECASGDDSGDDSDDDFEMARGSSLDVHKSRSSSKSRDTSWPTPEGRPKSPVFLVVEVAVECGALGRPST